MEYKNIKKILIFALCGIGDIIMLTPTLRAFKKLYPKSKITVVIRQNKPKELLSNNPYVDEVLFYPNNFIIDIWSNWLISKEKKTNVINLFNELKFLLMLRREKYDLSLWAFPGETKRSAIVSLISGARIKMGYMYDIFGIKTSFLYNHFIESIPSKHAVDENLEYLRFLRHNEFDKKLCLVIPKKFNTFFKNFIRKNKIRKGDKLIGIHPGCDKRNKHKRWPVEKFFTLVKKLNKNKSLKILIFEGPDELRILDEFQGLNIIPCKNLSFFQLSTIIERCDVLLTTDSGLGHIAAALKVPTVTIFGPANPNKTCPYGNNGIAISKLSPVIYLSGDKERIIEEGTLRLREISSEEVYLAIIRILKKIDKNEKN